MILGRCVLCVGLAGEPTAVDPRVAEPAPALEWPQATDAGADRPSSTPVTDARPEKQRVPRPVPGPLTRPPVRVAVGLSPQAPGSRDERALLDRLEASVSASTNPPTTLRRLRAGSGGARLICRGRRGDLVISIGYVPGRLDAVVLAHDCGLDRPLGVRAAVAADEAGLVAALWQEREQLVREGVRDRRRLVPMGPKARGALIAAGVLVVVGVAVGLLVASALREERVVLTVSP